VVQKTLIIDLLVSSLGGEVHADEVEVVAIFSASVKVVKLVDVVGAKISILDYFIQLSCNTYSL
jgi:hypothetical protein